MLQWEVRDATLEDGPELLRLRGLMFEAMGTTVADPGWADRFGPAWAEGLTGGRLLGAVVDHPSGGGLVASGIAAVVTRLPAPNRPSEARGYVSSVSTEPAWQRRGCARAIVRRLLDRLAAQGAVPVELHATRHGEGLYRSLGFVEREHEVELRWFG